MPLNKSGIVKQNAALKRPLIIPVLLLLCNKILFLYNLKDVQILFTTILFSQTSKNIEYNTMPNKILSLN